MGNRLSVGGRVDYLVRLIFIAAALFGFACESNAYGVVASAPATVGNYTANSFGQGTGYACTSDCAGSYQAATDIGINRLKATQSANWPSTTYGSPTYTNVGTSPPSVRQSVVASFTNQSGPTTTTLSSTAKVFCDQYPAGTNRTATGSIPTFTCYGTIPPTCPSHSSFVGVSCYCATDYKPNTGATACEQITSTACTTIAAGLTSTQATLQGGTFKSLTSCNSGCVLTATDGYGTNGDWWLTGTFTATGGNCDGNSPTTGTDTTPTTDPLPSGYCSGTVNGTTVTVPCSDTVSKEDTTTTTSATSASGVSTPGATTTQTSTTTCSGGNCTQTTTTTTTNPDGSKTTSTEQKTEPKPQDSFCKENPNSKICKDNTASTSCAAGVSSVECEGDAIQCAVLREQIKRNCQLFDKTNPQSEAGVAAVAAGDRPGDHPRNSPNTENMSFASRIDQSSLIGASCPADVSVSMGGSFPPVVVAFSKICEPAGILGNVGVAFAGLVCLFIVFRRD